MLWDPPIFVVITPQEFKQRWEDVPDDRLISFPESSFADVRVVPDARAFLVEAGLPAEAAPCLDFGPPKNGTLERVSTIWHQPSAFDRYLIIGGNGSGDPVCLDEATEGEVVYLNHDNKFKRVLMASSVFSLAECLLELRDAIVKAGGDTERVGQQDYDALLARFRLIDPASSGKGGFWEQELGSFRAVQDKAWWKFLTKKLW
jgi:hypothetical protein